MIKISSDESIMSLVKKHPQIKEIMVESGFADITKPGMLQTAGRIMTLKKGAKVKNIPWDKIKEIFESHGFLIEEEDNE